TEAVQEAKRPPAEAAKGGAKGGGGGGKGGTPKKSIWDIQLGGPPKPKIGGEGLAIFTRQFSTMIGAGIPVLECLDILEEQAEDPGFKAVCGKIIEDVRSGSD